jgi:hypothetical protein
VGVLSEEDSVGMGTDEVYIPSAFSVKKAELEVGLIFRVMDTCVYAVTCAFIFTVQASYNMTSNSENVYCCFIYVDTAKPGVFVFITFAYCEMYM